MRVNVNDITMFRRRFPMTKTDNEEVIGLNGEETFIFARHFGANVSNKGKIVVKKRYLAHGIATHFSDLSETFKFIFGKS
jgi:hypothetical protein